MNFIGTDTKTLGISVGPEDVYAVLEAWTGIPADRLRPGGLRGQDLEQLAMRLADRVFGQDRAIETSVAGIRRRFQLPERQGLRRPVWAALFAGPSGVGKTQLARELAAHFFGEGDGGLIKLDLSEFREEHTIARLVGAPPGYKGHGEGGQLTNALRRCRAGVVVLDEVEKAHESILTTVVLPMIGEGIVHDMNDGRVLDVTDMIVILTTNLGTNQVTDQPVGFNSGRNAEQAGIEEHVIRAAIGGHFPREVLGRLDDVIVFAPLSDGAVRAIWRREVVSLQQRLASRNVNIRIDVPEDVEAVCLEQITRAIRHQGARAVVRLFDRAVADKCLDLLREGMPGACVFRVERSGEDGLRYTLVPEHE